MGFENICFGQKHGKRTGEKGSPHTSNKNPLPLRTLQEIVYTAKHRQGQNETFFAIEGSSLSELDHILHKGDPTSTSKLKNV